MRIPVLLFTAVFLVGFVPGDDCRALQNSVSTKHGPGQQSELRRLIPRDWVRLDEEYISPQAEAYNNPSILDRSLIEIFPFDAASKMPQAQFQRTLHGAFGSLDGVYGRHQDLVDEMPERAKRQDTGMLSSFDVPMHVLNKKLERQRAEEEARQAEENRKLMDAVGK